MEKNTRYILSYEHCRQSVEEFRLILNLKLRLCLWFREEITKCDNVIGEYSLLGVKSVKYNSLFQSEKNGITIDDFVCLDNNMSQ